MTPISHKRPSTARAGHRSSRSAGSHHRASTSASHVSRGHGASTVQKGRPLKHSSKKEPVLRFVPLGGLEEIGRNMMFFEYADEIVIIDAGLQFPEEETPGIDYIIPNIEYLEANKSKIRAILITHAHYDHIGAIPYILGKLNNPPMYVTRLTKEIIMKRQEDFPNSPKPNFEIIKAGDVVHLSEYFSAGFFDIAHNVPDSVGIILQTPAGKIVNPGDFKLSNDEHGKPQNLELWGKIGKKDILALFLDSTNAEVPGYSVSEKIVERNLEEIFRKAEGRIIVGTFASLLDRLFEMVKIAERLGKKVSLSGYSMKTNMEIAQNLGLMKAERGTIIPMETIHKYPDNKILVLCTGAQGESNASMMKIVNGEHKHIQIKKGDTVVFSSSIIPGNERSVQTLKDNLARQGAIIFNSEMVDIHSSGHAPQEELKTVMRMVKPKFFIPVHGYYFMRHTNIQHAKSVGIPEKNCALVDNGQVVEITKDSIKITDETVPAYYVMVDGLGVGDVGEVVLRDRKVLAQEGMLVIITTVDKATGRLLKNPDIISRGFIYLRENQEILNDVRKKIRATIERIPHNQTLDSDYLKGLIRDQVGQFLYNKTKRRPMVLPVVIEI